MKQVNKSVLLWYTPQEMYELVTAVERYPEFLPWCNKVEVLAREDDTVTARLHLSYAGVRHAFTTRNVNAAGESVRMELVDGPFSRLHGLWQFQPLNKPGTTGAPTACKIAFEFGCAANEAEARVVDDVLRLGPRCRKRLADGARWLRLRQIGGDDDGPRLTAFFDLVGQRIQSIDPPCHQCQRMAVPREDARQLDADAGRCAGDQGDRFHRGIIANVIPRRADRNDENINLR